MLQSMGSQRVGHNLATKQHQQYCILSGNSAYTGGLLTVEWNNLSCFHKCTQTMLADHHPTHSLHTSYSLLFIICLQARRSFRVGQSLIYSQILEALGTNILTMCAFYF